MDPFTIAREADIILFRPSGTLVKRWIGRAQRAELFPWGQDSCPEIFARSRRRRCSGETLASIVVAVMYAGATFWRISRSHAERDLTSLINHAAGGAPSLSQCRQLQIVAVPIGVQITGPAALAAWAAWRCSFTRAMRNSIHLRRASGSLIS